MSLVVVDNGHRTTVQDHGRFGHRPFAVPRSGALDVAAADRANAVVGNPPGTVVLETGGGLVVSATYRMNVGLGTTGEVVVLERGENLTIGPGDDHRWEYLAVEGGFTMPPVLGSRSKDTVSAVGPLPVVAGARLNIGPQISGARPEIPETVAAHPLLRLWAGPHAARHRPGPDAMTTLPWTVVDVDRRCAILRGESPVEVDGDIRAVETPIPEGAVYVGPAGELVVALNDHPTTTRSPIVAVVDDRDLARLCHHRDGSTVRFTPPDV